MRPPSPPPPPPGSAFLSAAVFVDVIDDAGAGCPADAADPDNTYALAIADALEGADGVLSASVVALGCLQFTLTTELRWTFNINATYFPATNDLRELFGSTLEGFGGNPPPTCFAIDGFCAPFDALGTPVSRTSGITSKQLTCDVLPSVPGVVDLASDPNDYLPGRVAGTFFVLASTQGWAYTLAGPTFTRPNGDVDSSALSLSATSGSVSLVGRPFSGPACPQLLNPSTARPSAWSRPSDITIGALGELSSIRFRLLPVQLNPKLDMPSIGLQVTRTPVGFTAPASEVLELVWSCSSQDDTSQCGLDYYDWFSFEYDTYIKLSMVSYSSSPCQEAVTPAAASVEFPALYLEDLVAGATSATTILDTRGRTVRCTSRPLGQDTRILAVQLKLASSSGTTEYYVDDILLSGPFTVLDATPGLTFPSYAINFNTRADALP